MEGIDLFEKKFSILQEISNAVVVTDNVITIANLMLDLAINYTNAEKGSLMLVNEQGELYILAARGIDPQLVKTYKVKVGEGIAGTVAGNRAPVLVEDIDKDQRFKGKTRDRYKTRSFISCPIIIKSRLFGVLNINDKKDDKPFIRDEFDLLKIIANQAAAAFENAFLMNQLKAKAAELEDINRKLIETDVMKTEFLTRISHELRTPLNSISGSIYYLQKSDKLSKEEQNEFYTIVTNEIAQLTGTVENLLDFLRLEDEAKIIRKGILDPVTLLKEILDSKLLRTVSARKNLQVRLNVGEGIADIVGDKVKVSQLFINLIDGLTYYLEIGDSIEIAIRQNDFVDIDFILSRRIPDAVIPSLFESRDIFSVAKPDERLKLYLAKRAVEVHRWDVAARNRDNTCVVSLKVPKSTAQKKEAIINTTIELFIDFLAEVFGLNICSIMLGDELTGDLTIKSARGLEDEVIKRTRIKLGDRIAGWVAHEGKPLLIEDVEKDPRFGRISIPQYNTHSLLSVPIKAGSKVVGVINLNNKKSGEPFTARDLSIASVLSERLSRFIESVHSGEHTEEDFKHFMTSFDSLLTAEKRYTKKGVLFPDLMMMIQDHLGATEEERKAALYVSVVYDLGLVPVYDSIMKKEKLLSSDMRTIRVHPYTTVSLLNNFEFSDEVKNAILHHHERYDGTGYPDKLKGEEIPFISRVVSVVDAYCAMIEERPYRPAFTKDDAVREIRKLAGTVYDPRVAEALEAVYKKI